MRKAKGDATGSIMMPAYEKCNMSQESYVMPSCEEHPTSYHHERRKGGRRGLRHDVMRVAT
eukprot:6040641-Pleurochrysis_carterae.AAC.1